MISINRKCSIRRSQCSSLRSLGRTCPAGVTRCRRILRVSTMWRSPSISGFNRVLWIARGHCSKVWHRSILSYAIMSCQPYQTSAGSSGALSMAECAALSLATIDDIYVLLVDRQGDVLWRTNSNCTSQKAEALSQRLAERFTQTARTQQDASPAEQSR